MRRVYKELGRRLRVARVAAGLTQDEVARRVGLGRTSITNIERGNQQISLHLFLSLASALGETPEALITNLNKAGTAVPPEVVRALSDKDLEWVQRVVSSPEGDGGSREKD